MLPKMVSPRGSAGLALMWVRGAVVLILLSGFFSVAQSKKPQPRSKTGSEGTARGKYIVESVAMCGDCHTPKEPNGSPNRAHWLQGTPVPFSPVKPDSNWPINAPRIGGTPLPASDADMVKLLTTGIWTSGARLRAPMPQFRMNAGDAEAVVAYLKTVKARQ